VSDEVPAIFRQQPHYIITTGGSGISMKSEDPAALINIFTSKPEDGDDA